MSAAPGKRSHCSSGSDGFTLIEVLVAFTVLALVTMVIQRGVVAAASATARAEDRIGAEVVARSLMTAPLGSGPDSLRPRSGTMNGHAWQIRFERARLPVSSTSDGGSAQWVAMRMIISVNAKQSARHDLTVETIRLARVSP